MVVKMWREKQTGQQILLQWWLEFTAVAYLCLKLACWDIGYMNQCTLECYQKP